MYTTKDIYSYTGKLYAAANTPVKIIAPYDHIVICENLETGYRFPTHKENISDEPTDIGDRPTKNLVDGKADKLRTQKRSKYNGGNATSHTLFG